MKTNTDETWTFNTPKISSLGRFLKLQMIVLLFVVPMGALIT